MLFLNPFHTRNSEKTTTHIHSTKNIKKKKIIKKDTFYPFFAMKKEPLFPLFQQQPFFFSAGFAPSFGTFVFV